MDVEKMKENELKVLFAFIESLKKIEVHSTGKERPDRKRTVRK
jgi:hypothetical protein